MLCKLLFSVKRSSRACYYIYVNEFLDTFTIYIYNTYILSSSELLMVC